MGGEGTLVTEIQFRMEDVDDVRRGGEKTGDGQSRCGVGWRVRGGWRRRGDLKILKVFVYSFHNQRSILSNKKNNRGSRWALKTQFSDRSEFDGPCFVGTLWWPQAVLVVRDVSFLVANLALVVFLLFPIVSFLVRDVSFLVRDVSLSGRKCSPCGVSSGFNCVPLWSHI